VEKPSPQVETEVDAFPYGFFGFYAQDGSVQRPPPRIVVSADLNSDFGRGVLLGVADYASHQERWRLVSDRLNPDYFAYLMRTGVDGIIVQAADPLLIRRALKTGVPVVNFSTRIAPTEIPFPTVGPDNRAAGRLAAQHLVDLHQPRLAFIGIPRHYYSRERRAGVATVARDAGIPLLEPPETRVPGRVSTQEEGRRMIRRFLSRLPLPCGVVTCNDAVGCDTVEAASALGLRVPDDIAVVGMDDNATECFSVWPNLTSIQLPTRAIGREAARILHRLLRGGRAPRAPIWMGGGELVARASSNHIALSDPWVARALRHMRDHHTRALSVPEIARVAGISRRALEQRFSQLLNSSPARELRKLRLSHARHLLRTTSLGMDLVAERSGFSSARQMSETFREQTGSTPSSQRQMANP